MRQEATAAMARFPGVQMPERPRGTVEEQIRSLYRSLWQVAESLEIIIDALNKEDSSSDPGKEKKA